MDILLDTHVLLWWDSRADQLGSASRDAISDPQNSVYISSASIWEIAIKNSKGKLHFTGLPSAIIERNDFLPLLITPAHAEIAGLLEWSHPDPFDRMLVAQARTNNMILVHADSIIQTYRQVPQLWAR